MPHGDEDRKHHTPDYSEAGHWSYGTTGLDKRDDATGDLKAERKVECFCGGTKKYKSRRQWRHSEKATESGIDTEGSAPRKLIRYDRVSGAVHEPMKRGGQYNEDGGNLLRWSCSFVIQRTSHICASVGRLKARCFEKRAEGHGFAMSKILGCHDLCGTT